jgi:hypothetical protein
MLGKIELEAAKRILTTVQILLDSFIDAARGANGEGHLIMQLKDLHGRAGDVIGELDGRIKLLP